jgi:hypothetical protein
MFLCASHGLICFVKVGSVSKAEFLAMGQAGVRVGYDYYTGKYNTLGGELYALKRDYQGAGVFNPKKLRELPVASLESLIDLLANFGFPEVTEEFLAGMKAELPEVIRDAKQPFDYSEMEGVAEYDAALVQARRKPTADAAPTVAAAAPAAPAPTPAAAAAPVRVPTFNTWEDGGSAHLEVVAFSRLEGERVQVLAPGFAPRGHRANVERPDQADLVTA